MCGLCGVKVLECDQGEESDVSNEGQSEYNSEDDSDYEEEANEESSEDENKESSEDESDHSSEAESASSHEELEDCSEHQGELQAGLHMVRIPIFYTARSSAAPVMPANSPTSKHKSSNFACMLK